MKKIYSFLFLICFSSVLVAQIDTAGLIGYYKFNASLKDASNRGNNASSGSVVYASDWQGNANASAAFTQSSSPIILGKNAFDFSNSSTFTLAAYVYATSTPTYGSFLAKNEEWMQNGYTFGFGSNNELRFNTNLSFSISSTSAFPTNKWRHVAVTYDNGNVRMFENGTQVASGSVTSLSSNNYDLIVGRIYNSKNGYNFEGSIDEVAIYNRALTSSEINSLFWVANNVGRSIENISAYSLKNVDKNIYSINSNDVRNITVKIYATDGRLLLNTNANNNSTIDLNNLPAGIYITSVEGELGNSTGKIMVY
ncbi:MAG: T9SS type A sorting domain-containing protein [Bacteroidetes bacterium]|nr:T9SS type A sorting domain-containing protein [Bacteroidota bacterium]